MKHVPPAVMELAPKQKASQESDPINEMGGAVIALLREAANSSNENVDRAMSMAHKLAIQLRAAEDRIADLQKEVEGLQSRVTRAEWWLTTIKEDIQDKLIATLEANRIQKARWDSCPDPPRSPLFRCADRQNPASAGFCFCRVRRHPPRSLAQKVPSRQAQRTSLMKVCTLFSVAGFSLPSVRRLRNCPSAAVD